MIHLEVNSYNTGIVIYGIDFRIHFGVKSLLIYEINVSRGLLGASGSAGYQNHKDK